MSVADTLTEIAITLPDGSVKTFAGAVTGQQIAASIGNRLAAAAKFCRPVDGTHLAISCNSRKLLAFKLDEIPEMARGRGVALTKKGIDPVDMKIFTPKTGLSWKSGERTRTLDDVKPWIAKRAQSGRIVPEGFPRSGKFS